MYAWANMGHPSRTKDRGWEMKSAGTTKLTLRLNQLTSRLGVHAGALISGLVVKVIAGSQYRRRQL